MNDLPIANIGQKIQNALGWNITSQLIIQILTLVSSIIVARILEPKDYGIVGIGLMLVGYANSFTNFGLANAIVQIKNLSNDQVNSVFVIDLVVSCIFFLVAMLSAPYIGKFFAVPESTSVIRILSFIFLLTTFSDMSRAMLRRTVDFRTVSKISLGEALLRSIMGPLLALLGLGYWTLVWSSVLPLFAATLTLLYASGWRPRFQYRHGCMTGIYDFSIWTFIRAQLYYLDKYIIQFVIARVNGPIELGYFDKSFSMSRLPLDSVSLSINSVMFSGFSRLQDVEDKLATWMERSLTMQIAIVMPMLLGLKAIAPQFVTVLLGTKWLPAIFPLEILCVAAVFRMLSGTFTAFNIGVGLYRQHTVKEGIGSGALCVLSVLLAARGISALCYVYLGISFIVFIMLLRLASRKIQFALIPLLKCLAPYLLNNLSMYWVVSLFASTKLEEASVTNLICLVCLGFLTYTCPLIAMNYFRRRSLFYPLISAEL